MDWLDDDSRAGGPPRLPGVPAIPPMPVVLPEAPAPTNKTIEVDPKWLELVEERRAKKKEPAPVSPPPRGRPIIPREDD